ncbi:peptide MFS transporter [Glacieibacterium frigidum]|uniref:MFS transporter n=1 Tax=Glacieibacterium frigidum TaxID=2593303 RepID=A0A552UHZ9_9SPHN|nr:oligopeptide:H+ symporter [Glacieibacterium frigidum]TRW17855.1 MFS transporter [Glacieibacterium frigidum]
MATTPAPTADTGWFGHPRQLARLFSTEMWERFGFYGMRALLTLYLAEHFLFSQSTTNGLYGAFTALVYLTPLLGGLLADRYLGSKKAVKFGALLMAAGYFTLCFGGDAAKPFATIDGQRYEVQVEKQGETSRQFIVDNGERLRIKGNDDGSVALLRADDTPARTLPKGALVSGGERSELYVFIMLAALSAVTVGNGFFKPNISTMVGGLYADGDRRRDAGFTIFYMGINIGAFLSQFFLPLIALYFGWSLGFGLAAVGMLLSYLLFQFDRGGLAGHGEPPPQKGSRDLVIYIAALAAIPLVWLLFRNTLDVAESAAAAAKAGTGIIGYFVALPLLGKIMFSTFLAAVVGIPLYAWRTGSKAEFQMMSAAFVLIVFNVVFWTLFEQAGSSLTFFADQNTERDLGWYLVPAGQVQVFNAIFIIMLAPVFSWLWLKLARRGMEPGIPVKFGIALIGAGAGFLALVFGTQFAGPDFKVGLGWIALIYFIHSAAELCISPVGLSMITKLSMARIVAMMMGVWFLSIAVAQYVAGIVAQFASVETVGGEVTNLRVSLETYAGVFSTIGWIAVGIGVVLLLISPFIKRWMHGVD